MKKDQNFHFIYFHFLRPYNQCQSIHFAIHFFYFLGYLGLRLYFSFTAISAASIGNSNIHFDHLLNS